MPVTTFAGGTEGPWEVIRIEVVRGAPLEAVEHLAIIQGDPAPGSTWALRGIPSYERYVTRAEHGELAARSPELGRPEATRAALIPIAKSEEWWQLPQDERRAIFEERSHHIATGLRYVPAVARRLYHGRDLAEPFDFLTWFEYAPANGEAFEELVSVLRATEEWTYVVREIDIRLAR
jgi:hypothetical protein